MPTDHIRVAHELNEGIGELRRAAPGVMKGFATLGAATYERGVLDAKLKELIALAIGVTVRCDGCVAHHCKAARDRGASRPELVEAIGVAIHMGGGPSMVYGVEALKAFDQFEQQDNP